VFVHGAEIRMHEEPACAGVIPKQFHPPNVFNT